MSDLGDFNLDQFKATYFEECSELLADAETRLMSLQQDTDNADPEDLHAIFRAVHSVKGGGGAFNFEQLVHFAHIYEALLDSMREERVAVTSEVVDLLLSANDVLNNLIQAAQEGIDLPEEAWADVAVELESLQSGATVEDDESLDDAADEEVIDLTGDEPEPSDVDADAVEATADTSAAGPKTFKVEFLPDIHLLQYANEPLLLIRELSSLGDVKRIIDCGKLPTFREMNADETYLSWVFFLTTEKGEADIEEVFEFVEDDCKLIISAATEDDYAQAFAKSDNGVIWSAQAAPSAEKAAPTKENVEEPKSEAEAKVAEPKKASVPAKAKATEPVAKTAPNPGAGGAAASAGAQKVSSIRVDLDRVDKLVNMVGELVITQAMLLQQSDSLPLEYSHIMKQGFEDLSMHTRELQDSVMAIRMQPVKSVFARMPRLVRELGGKLGKKVDLVMSGENTEVDKTVIELLADPLTHMIRNSLDHGIETVEEREATTKPERATVHLSAEHRSGRIQIDIADDGRGINRERVFALAVEKGVIEEDAQLTPLEIDELIFAPGFSTADEVTDVSGRGVGMDVVRRNISNLGGRISVSSVPGKGTKFTLSLPLTLAVLDGMVTAVGQEKYVIPLTAIVESIRPDRKDIHRLMNGGEVVYMRGEYIRLVYLYDVFGIPKAQSDPSKALVVIVELDGGNHAGIVVDDLLGQQQVVIKTLEDNYDPVAGVSAATILGNGLVALILDVDGLMEMSHGRAALNAPVDLEEDLMVESEQNYG